MAVGIAYKDLVVGATYLVRFRDGWVTPLQAKDWPVEIREGSKSDYVRITIRDGYRGRDRYDLSIGLASSETIFLRRTIYRGGSHER